MAQKKQETPKRPHRATGNPRGRPRNDGLPAGYRTPEQLQAEQERNAEILARKELREAQRAETDTKNQRFIKTALDGWSERPVDLNDFEAVKRRAKTYFQTCYDEDMIPNMAGVCRRLGITKSTFCDWKSGRKRDSRYKELAENIASIIEDNMVTLSLDNKSNTIATIVQLKNFFGYTDEQKVVVEPRKSLVDETMNMSDVLALAESPNLKLAEFTEGGNENDTE